MENKKKIKKNKKMNLGIFISDLGKHLIFALGIGADIRPQNRTRKIPVNIIFVCLICLISCLTSKINS